MTPSGTLPTVSPSTIDFLRQLRENNHRDWFNANRSAYETAKAGWEKWVTGLIAQIGKFDDVSQLTAKDCIFRINRDVRFSKDKSPYKVNFAAAIGRGGRHSKFLDYYLHLEPGNSFLGGGVYAPTSAELNKVRQEIHYNLAEIKKIIHEPIFFNYFGDVQGSRLKTTPKGYDRDHPEIEWLRLQQFFFMHPFTDAEVVAPEFLQKVVAGCLILKPLLDFFNYILFEEEPVKEL
jgi:uncharacterized protein (TIGR02453 family)